MTYGRQSVSVSMGPYLGASYQRILQKALEAQGISISRFALERLFPLRSASQNPAEIVHVDWIHPFYESSSSWKTVLKKARFSFDLALRKKVPLVWTIHNMFSHDANETCERDLIERFIEHTDVLVSLTRSGVDQIRSEFRSARQKRIVVVPHGHFCGAYANDVSRAEARSRLGLSDENGVALFLGRIRRYKGLHRLLPDWQAVAGSSDLLLIAGEVEDDQYGAELEAIMESDSRVRFIPGRVGDDDLQVYLNASDFFVAPFQRIFNSGSVILALSYGLPVVAPCTPVMREVIDESAFFAFTEEAGSLRESLGNALSDDSLAERGVRAREGVLKQGSWEDSAEILAELYRELAG